MKINKKYAIRKLAVGVASISIGLFVSNSVDIESFTNSTSLQNVAKAADEVTNWQPEGNIIAQGEDGVPWELYENGYLLFKPVSDKDTLTNSYGENQASWKKLHNDKIKAIGFSGKVYTPRDSRYLFSAANVSDYNALSNLEYIDSSKLDTSKTTYMYSMFSYLEKLKELDVSHFDTSQVDSMTEMFKNLKEVKTLDVSNWNVSNVTAIDDMFLGDEKLETLDVSKWQTSKIKYMSNVFYNNYKLKSLDVSRWNTSSATSISGIFSSAYELTELDVSNWDVSNVTSMYNAFEYNKKLKTLDLSRWNTSKVKYMSGMFAYDENLTELNLGNWNTSNVIDMHNMFVGDKNLVKLNITNWDTSNVEDINGMFSGLESLTHLTIGENFKNTTLKDNLFKNLDTHKYENIYTNRWHKEDNSKGPYTTQEWNNEYRANSSLLAGVWVREKVPTEYTVNFVTGTSENINPKKVEKDVPLDTPTPTVDKTGYKFLGWSKTPDGELITDKTNITTPGETITLYAKWEKVNNVVKRTETINKTKVYKSDDSLDLGVKNIEEGRDGEKEIVTTYTATPITGELTNPTTTENIITEMKPEVITVGTKPKVVVEEIPSPVKYEKDPTREKGKPNLIIEGTPGAKTTTTTYNVNPKTGDITENVGTPVVKEPTVKTIRIPAKDKVVVEEIPSPVKYEKDPTREKGKPNLIIEGVPGSKTITTTYNVNPKTGEITENVGSPLIKEPTTKIIRIPAKDKVVVEEIPSPIKYEKDPTREKGKPNLIIEGKTGSKTITTTYNIDPKTGEVTENVGTPVIKEPTTKIIRIPAKDKVVVEEIPSPVRYEKDPTRERGKPNLIIEGELGSKTITTTYNVNPKTGEITENVGSPLIKEPTTKIIRIPAKDKVVVTEIPATVRYKKDPTREIGKPNLIIESGPGSKTVVTTYNVNPKTGEITEKVGVPLIKEPIIEKTVIVPAKDKVVVEEIPSPVRYEKDPKREKGKPNLIIEGEPGSKTTTTTYNVDPKTGKVFEAKISTDIKNPKEKRVYVPAKDKVKEIEKPIEIKEQFNKDLPQEKERILTQGKPKKERLITEYKVNEKTGEITEVQRTEIVEQGEPTIKEIGTKKPTKKIVDPSGKEIPKEDLINYTEPNLNKEDGVTPEGDLFYIVKKIEVEYKGDPTLEKGNQIVEKDGKKDGKKVVRVGIKTKVELLTNKDNEKVKRTTTYVVDPKTGEITPTVKEEVTKVGEPLVENKMNVAIIQDEEGNILDIIKFEEKPKPIDGYTYTGKEKVDKEGNKVYIYKKTTETSKGTENPPVVENKDFVGGVNPSDSPIREALPELKVAIIKDSEDNILDVIKLEEEPKEIKGYKNTGKTTTDKEGNKVYIYEKVKENKKPVVEDKKDNLKENNKEVIKKKEELPKTTASMLAPFGLLTGLALRKKKK